MKVELWKNAALVGTVELDDPECNISSIVVQDTRGEPVADVYVRTMRTKFFHIDSKWIGKGEIES